LTIFVNQFHFIFFPFPNTSDDGYFEFLAGGPSLWLQFILGYGSFLFNTYYISLCCFIF